MSNERYPKQVFWSDEDEGYVALALDLPGCCAIGSSEAVALSELDDAIAAWIVAATASGNAIPPASRLRINGTRRQARAH